MPELFPAFLVSRDEFERAKAFWEQLTSAVAAVLDQRGEWTAWLKVEEWRNDSDQMDGAIVFSLYSESQNKGLRVQQSARSSSGEAYPYVTAFTDVFGEGHLDRPIRNLFIGAIPTDENLSLLRRLIARWFDRAVDSQSMGAFLEAELYLPYGKRG